MATRPASAAAVLAGDARATHPRCPLLAVLVFLASDAPSASCAGFTDVHNTLAAIKRVNAKLEAGVAAKGAETASRKSEVIALRESVNAMQERPADLAREPPRLAR